MTYKVHPKFKSIAFFMPSLAGGGAERVILTLAEEFSRYNIKVYLVLVKHQGHYISQVPKNIKIINLNTNQFYVTQKLSTFLKKYNPDVLLSAMDRPNIVAIWSKTLSRYKGKTIISVHTTTTRSCYNKLSLKSLITPTLVKLFYNKSDLIIAVSKGVSDDLTKKLKIKNKIITIYNPIDLKNIRLKSMETPSHPWLKNKETPILLGVGRLTKAKNFPLLIKATSLVIKKTPVRLIILGEGSDQAKINKLIKKLGLQQIISMPGFVKNPYSYMRRSSVFVLSSLWEGFGNVIVEALATSTPVVSTDCPNGPREILENGKYGTLVPIGDPYKMANAILSTIRSSQKVTHLNIDKFESKHIAGLYISSINKLF